MPDMPCKSICIESHRHLSAKAPYHRPEVSLGKQHLSSHSFIWGFRCLHFDILGDHFAISGAWFWYYLYAPDFRNQAILHFSSAQLPFTKLGACISESRENILALRERPGGPFEYPRTALEDHRSGRMDTRWSGIGFASIRECF